MSNPASPPPAVSLPALSPSNGSNPAPASGRLVCLDALRGFDMFWILGADALVQALGEVNGSAVAKFFAHQLDHRAWAGLTFYDLIFPLFVFISGASLVYSLSKQIEQHGRAAAAKRVLIRGAVLFVIGIFYSGGFTNPWPDMRLLGVLQRIALAYTGAGLLFCFLKPRALVAVGVAILVGYWALLTFAPIRDIQLDRPALEKLLGTPKPALPQVRAAFDATTARVTGGTAPGLNLTNHLDFQYLPGRKYDTYYDPEGFLSTLPAIVTCLIGVLAGLLMRRTDLDDARKLRTLLIAGAIGVALGWLWHPQFPVIKKLWTSSYVLVAGGYSLWLLGAFFYVVDMRGWRRWCVPFLWIGMNPITLYLANNVIGFRRQAARFVGGDIKAWLDAHLGAGAGQGLLAIVGLALMFVLARFLYERKIFLRV
jgi:predicted acyltransferase